MVNANWYGSFFVGITDFAQKQIGNVHLAQLELESQTIKIDIGLGKSTVANKV